MLNVWLAHWACHGFGYWAICDANDQSKIKGFGGVMRKQVGVILGLNLYFRLAPEAWERGLGIATAENALELAFVELNEPEVLALVRPDNLPSRRTIERAGLTLIDYFDDVPSQEHTIEYVFQDLLGESPRAYFAARRLNLCRQELMAANSAEVTVASMATRFGFYELGRFASVYRHFFGELPSQTLRRNKGLVAVGMPSLV